ncbi:MAG: M14 family zinc carboxypeptidase, partial [candidate division KSB1 bacterium]|nr:M14 family zinc carboxypeptidase [candidate division KSB1 bacterium]
MARTRNGLAGRCLSFRVSAAAGNLERSARKRARASAGSGLLLLGLLVGVGQGQIPSPDEYLGFPLGGDGRLASLEQILDYFRLLDERSPCLTVRELGRTTGGRPFRLVMISSERNLASLGEIRAARKRLADPRRLSVAEACSLMRKVPVVVSVNGSIHATEVGAAQMAPRLAYDLLTEQLDGARAILDSVLILLIPVHNPDGLALVKGWCDRVAGTRYEGTSPPQLNHPYAGHDNNRDWFAFTQPETQLTVDSVYNVWYPQIVLDMHQMGMQGARVFVPPYVDPVDPCVDPELVAAMNELGHFVQARSVEQGLAGVVTSALFDAYTPARAYPNYHGGIRFLSEVASCRIAWPIELAETDLRGDVDYHPLRSSANHPLPWRGGRWSLEDVLRYHEAVAHSVLLHAALNRTRWVERAFHVLRRQCEWRGSPLGYAIPLRQWDPSSAQDLVAALRRGGIEIYRDGEELVVPLAQPFGSFAHTLLRSGGYEPPRVGDQLRKPYDVTAHNLALLFGVAVRPLDCLPPKMTGPVAGFPRTPWTERRSDCRTLVLDGRANASFALAARALRSGLCLRRLRVPQRVGYRAFPAGSFVVEGEGGLVRALAELADSLRIPMAACPAEVDLRADPVRLARAALYQSWLAPTDEGWARWVLDQYELPYRVLHDSDVRAGLPDSL